MKRVKGSTEPDAAELEARAKSSFAWRQKRTGDVVLDTLSPAYELPEIDATVIMNFLTDRITVFRRGHARRDVPMDAWTYFEGHMQDWILSLSKGESE